jgi:hypothetical protein
MMDIMMVLMTTEELAKHELSVTGVHLCQWSSNLTFALAPYLTISYPIAYMKDLSAQLMLADYLLTRL